MDCAQPSLLFHLHCHPLRNNWAVALQNGNKAVHHVRSGMARKHRYSGYGVPLRWYCFPHKPVHRSSLIFAQAALIRNYAIAALMANFVYVLQCLSVGFLLWVGSSSYTISD
jgi:hypothetical protein